MRGLPDRVGLSGLSDIRGRPRLFTERTSVGLDVHARSVAAAAIDVWYQYPDGTGYGEPSRLPFDQLSNVLMTPHISGVTRDTFVGRVRDITDNISRLHSGREVLRVVAPS